MNISSVGKRTVFIIAASLLMLCVIWTFTRGRSSERQRICNLLSDYGYTVHEDDLLFAYDDAGTTIKNATGSSDEELAAAVEASKAGGFPSRVEEKGGVTLVMAKDSGHTVYLYMLNGEFELCFAEDDNGNVLPLRKGE